MTVEIGHIKGITPELEAYLRERGIKDSDQFLELTKTRQGRRDLAKATGVEEKMVLELTNRADLIRIKGVGAAFADLLEEAGVDTVKELATRRADNLHAKLTQVNADKHLVGRTVTIEMVKEWITHAKDLPGGIEY